MNRAFPRQQAKIEGGVHLEVLHVKPRSRIGRLRHQQRQRRAEEGGLDGKDNLWLPEDLAKHHRQAAEHEREKVRHALEAGRLGRNVERRAIDDRLARNLLRAVKPAAIVLADAPRRIVRRSGHHADFMPSRSQPRRHLAGILADAGQLRGIVKPVDQNSQTVSSDTNDTERG